MVETRRTSRRLQAKAASVTGSPSPSPMSSPAASTRKSRRTPSPRSRATKPQDDSETARDELAQEVPVATTDEDEERKEEQTDEKKTQKVVAVDSETESEKEQDKKEQKQEQTEEKEAVAEAAEEEEEIMLLDEKEEEEEDEDIDQYAFLAASGLNLSTKPPASSSTSTSTTATVKPSTAVKQPLVPNQLDSGASQYQEFFNFEGSRRSQAATLRDDTRAREEAAILAASHKAVAHSERQRVESQHKRSAGRRWFNFESEEMTDNARRDFALLRMRNYLDPKKFYKSSDHSRALPKHFQLGVVIEGAHEFHSARLTKKQRRKTFTDEIMADEAVVQYTQRVAGNIQQARSNQGNKKRRRN